MRDIYPSGTDINRFYVRRAYYITNDEGKNFLLLRGEGA